MWKILSTVEEIQINKERNEALAHVTIVHGQILCGHSKTLGGACFFLS